MFAALNLNTSERRWNYQFMRVALHYDVSRHWKLSWRFKKLCHHPWCCWCKTTTFDVILTNTDTLSDSSYYSKFHCLTSFFSFFLTSTMIFLCKYSQFFFFANEQLAILRCIMHHYHSTEKKSFISWKRRVS